MDEPPEVPEEHYLTLFELKPWIEKVIEEIQYDLKREMDWDDKF